MRSPDGQEEEAARSGGPARPGYAEGRSDERAAIVRWLDFKGYTVTAQRIAQGVHNDGPGNGE
jgi:hypothetical protein